MNKDTTEQVHAQQLERRHQEIESLMDQVSRLKRELAAAHTELHETRMQKHTLRRLLNYVFYARLPSGDKVEDYISPEYEAQVISILEKTKS